MGSPLLIINGRGRRVPEIGNKRNKRCHLGVSLLRRIQANNWSSLPDGSPRRGYRTSLKQAFSGRIISLNPPKFSQASCQSGLGKEPKISKKPSGSGGFDHVWISFRNCVYNPCPHAYHHALRRWSRVHGVVEVRMPQSVVKFHLCMSPALHEKLASLAHDDRVSLNTVVVRYLTAAVEAREAKTEAIPSLQGGTP
jgi:hypothetical protein